MPGPLPNPQSRRRNQPTIPTTGLPVAGRSGDAPVPPYELGEAGRAWWTWAWGLPQATVWDAGALYGLARRAQLEDDIRSLEEADGLDLSDYMSVDDEDRDAAKRLETLIRKLKALAGGRVSVMREMRELDNRFGLNAKAMADLRWSIEKAEEPEEPKSGARVRRLRAVDPKAS
jgi:hypothetical protein